MSPSRLATSHSRDHRTVTVPASVSRLLAAILAWAADRVDVRSVLLVGSFARGTASPRSDVDLVLIVDEPSALVGDPSWATRFGEVERREVEDWGRVTAVRVWYNGGLEVEFGCATPAWAGQPLEEGTRQVLGAGFILLHDPAGLFRHLPGNHLAGRLGDA